MRGILHPLHSIIGHAGNIYHLNHDLGNTTAMSFVYLMEAGIGGTFPKL